jgi:hypothetical protein
MLGTYTTDDRSDRSRLKINKVSIDARFNPFYTSTTVCNYLLTNLTRKNRSEVPPPLGAGGRCQLSTCRLQLTRLPLFPRSTWT